MTNNSSYPISHLLSDVWSFVRSYRGKFWLATMLRFTSDLVWLYPAWALGQITTFFAHFSFGQSLTPFLWLIGGYALVGLYRYSVIEIAKCIGYQVAERSSLDAKLKTLGHLFRLDLIWHEKINSGIKMKRISNGGEGIDRILRIYYTNILESVFNIIAVVFILRTLGIGFMLAFVFFVITYYTLSYLQTIRSKRQSILVSQKEEELDGVAFEAINNIVTIKTMGMARAITGYLGESMDRLMKEIRKRIQYFRTREATLSIYMMSARLAGYVFIGYGISQGHYEIGLLVMFDGYFHLVYQATSELAEVTNEIAIHTVAVGRMMELIEVKPTIEGRPDARAYPKKWKHIAIQHLSFAYHDRNVLTDINLTIARGEKIGIVGLSGAGKSTLFKILLKLYEHYDGNILVDSTPLKDINRDAYIRHSAIVMQDTELFDLTLRQNVLIAVDDEKKHTESELMRALQISHLDDLLAHLPAGVDTLIGEKGIRLSGGEKQRLGIARAVYKRPDIFFLDEATSHLDADSERKIQDSLHQFFQNVTAIVIAHRLSTIKQMDRIIVIDEGKIVETGTWDELLKKKGVFFMLWEKQKLA